MLADPDDVNALHWWGPSELAIAVRIACGYIVYSALQYTLRYKVLTKYNQARKDLSGVMATALAEQWPTAFHNSHSWNAHASFRKSGQ